MAAAGQRDPHGYRRQQGPHFLAVESFGWRAMFIAVGLGSLLWLVPWLMVAKADTPARDIAGRTAGPGWSELLRCPTVWGTSIGMFALGYMIYFLLSWLPSYLVSERGLSMTNMALLGSLPFWAMAASSVLSG